MRVPSPPPRRLSRSSIDLRDLELQHEKLSHTDSAPSIVGIDKYLKSSDSEPLHFQQQLRQQLKFQEQIQQQYHFGGSKEKPKRQNSLKKINNFLQPFFFPNQSKQQQREEERESASSGNLADGSDDESCNMRSNAKISLLGDNDSTERNSEEPEKEDEPRETISPQKRLSDDVDMIGGLGSPQKCTNFYINFYNEKIVLGPDDEQRTQKQQQHNTKALPSYYGGALSESDFLTIKDIANELDNSDNLQTEDEELRGCANNTLLPVGNVRNRRGRRRSSSCEEIPASSKGKISVGALVHQRLKAKRKEKAAAVVTDEDEEEHSSVIWKNFANKSRFGSRLKKFNSSSRLLVGSLFGSHCDRSSSGSKYKSFARNRNIMWSMDETTYRRKEDDEEEGDVDVEGNNKKKNSVGGVEGHAAANQLTIKRSNEQLMSTKADIIKNLICKSSKNNGHLGVDVSSSLSPPSSTSSSESGSAMVAVKHQSTGLSKRGEQPRRQHRVNRQRMRVFSDGNFDERVIDNENQLQKNKRPRVLSEGHESNSVRAGSGQDQMRELQGKRSTTTTTTTAGAAVAVSSSTNDTPDILVGLVNRTTIGDEDNQLEGETEHEQAQTTQAAKEQQPPPLESMIADLRHVVEKSHLMQGESMKNVDSSEKKKTVAMEKVLLMDMSEAEQQKYLQDTNRGGEPPQAAEKRDQPTSVTTKGGSNLITPNVNLSMVDQELLRAISNVTPVGGTTMTGKQDNDNMLDVLGTTTTKETIVPLGNGAPITTTSTSTTTTQTTATKPEIVMDSTVIMMKGSNNSGRVGNGKVDELSGSEKLSARNSLATPNNTKSPSALLKRDAHGMRLRQASVVTYDVNVINFGGTDDASDNYNYNGHGSFSSAAGQSNIVQHNGRHQSTSSASKLRVELHGILWNGWFRIEWVGTK